MLNSIERAAVNICFTERDRLGLRAASPTARLARLRPFIDTTEFLRHARSPEPGHLVTVAMMRPGDKFDSYARLAAALETLLHLPWTLSVVGDGILQQAVRNLFSDIPAERLSGMVCSNDPTLRHCLPAAQYTSGPVAERPTDWPIWKLRQPACLWLPITLQVSRKSCNRESVAS